MKIIFIGTRDIHMIGGIESYMFHLTKELASLGHTPVVYCESNRNRVVYEDGVKIVYRKGLKSNLLCKPILGLFSTLHAILHERHISLIHYNAWPPSIWSFIPRIIGIKSLMQGHGLEWKRTKYSPKEQKILKFMEMITAYTNQHLIMCSEGQTIYFKKQYNLTAVTIPTAVTLPDTLIINKSNILAKHKLSNKKYFLFMSRLVQDKNPDFLIKAFIRAKKSDYKLVIAGNNETDVKYVDYLHRLAVDCPNVVFTGAVYGEDKSCLLQNAFIYCLPSTIEGLSISLLEAMSYKLPVIASDIDANKELLGDNAIWVRPESVSDLIFAFEYGIENYSKLASFIENNFKKVADNYTWKVVAQKYLNYLHSLGLK